MKAAVKIFLACAICILFPTGCQERGIPVMLNTSAAVKTIRVVTDDNYPPYSFRGESGELEGILVDQWALWEKRTGIPVELVGMPWGEALAAMQYGEFDVIDTIFLNAERERLYDFTPAYCNIDVPIFFSSMLSGINGVESLHGFSVAVKRGDYSVGYLQEHGIANLTEYSSYEDIIAAAKDKKALVFVMDKPPALYLMVKANIQDKFNYTAPLYSGEFHRAVKKGDSSTLMLVQQGFSEITADEYKGIDSKWFGSEVPANKYLPYIGYAIGVILLMVLSLALWNRVLKRMVRKRTAELEDALERLKRKESENTAIIDSIPQLILMLNKDGVFTGMLSAKNAAELSMPMDGVIGKRIADIVPPDLAKSAERSFSKLLSTGEMQRLEYAYPVENGTLYIEASTVICDDERILAFISNITERKKAELQLYEMSVYDSLTHLYNRNYFEQKVHEYERTGKPGVGYFTCDLDGLKLINDTLGHTEGDEYIRLTAEIIQRAFDGQDVVARIGGDEFGILVHNASERLLENKKEEIIRHISQANAVERPMPISLSFGYALWSDPRVPLDDVLKEADDRMYRDKLNHMQSMKSKNIALLAKMLEARDFITQDHGERLQELSGRLAQASGLSASDTRDVMLLAKFHDIGKIGVPDAILFKKDSLNEDEINIMRRHAEIGYRIASSSPELLHIADWILKHHEKYDGTGYPLGLRGKEIPLQCRIVAILDAYDAMTNDRPYRKAIPAEAAMQELRRCAGTQFDPLLVEKFCRIAVELCAVSNY